MEQASIALSEAEEASALHQKRAIRDPTTAHQSEIYPAGSEYALCQAETQLMAAVIGVLNESLTESLKGFYKLRTAFSTLQKIVDAEKKYLDKWTANKHLSQGRQHTGNAVTDKLEASPARPSGLPPTHGAPDATNEQDFTDAKEALSDQSTPNAYQGNVEHPQLSKDEFEDIVATKFNHLSISSTQPLSVPNGSKSAAEDASDTIDFRTVTSNPIDLFLHSGSNLCMGLLQLLLSMIPPAFGKILSFFSFRGDRLNGLRMLWSATRFKYNINGAMAGLITLAFHNLIVAPCDILNNGAWPETQLRILLKDMRQLYPKSKLWLLEESRMAAIDQDLENALTLASADSECPLKQVEAVCVFEKALNFMYMHHYQECADSFMKCVDLNNWSHGVYYFLAGVCYIELYRIHRTTELSKAAEFAKKADDLLHTALKHTGRKTFIGRQRPHDVFISRKIAKWEHRANTQGCTFVDAVGVSPVTEMTYFWSGFRRMNPELLRTSLDRLSWAGDPEPPSHEESEPIDERAIRALLQATCLRCLNQVSEAKSLLSERIFCYESAQLKACDYPDVWPLPVAHYELAVCLWQEAGGGNSSGDSSKLKQCSEELLKVEKWESFDLEARLGMKVATARETLRRCGVSNP